MRSFFPSRSNPSRSRDRGGSVAATVLFGIGLASCGDSSEPKSAPISGAHDAPRTEAPDSPSAPKSKEPRGAIDPAKVGTIRGVVHFDGDAPQRKPLAIGSTGGCPEHATPPLSEDALVENGKVANVFVWIKDGLAGWDLPPAQNESRFMDQKGCLYVPHVLGLRVGESVLVRNSDPTTHNVHIRSRSNEELNPVQPPNGKPVEWRPAKRELGVSFECNLHPWMRALVCVVDEPWFAVSASDGSFTLEGVPPGDYVLEAWHEKYGKKTANVRVESGGSTDATFTYKPSDKPR